MAAKRKSGGPGQISLKLNDERFPKLLGLFCLFMSVYLGVAFFSYLFSWQEDQDHVQRFSWAWLMQTDIEAANWLGRLGALISDMFFYWGFGLPSFLVIVMLAVVGISLVKRFPLSVQWPFLRSTLVGMALLSVILQFASSFFESEFPWGGAFGTAINDWLGNLLGTAGMILLLLFLLVAYIVWDSNPNMNELSVDSVKYHVRHYLQDLVTGKRWRRAAARAIALKHMEEERTAQPPLKRAARRTQEEGVDVSEGAEETLSLEEEQLMSAEVKAGKTAGEAMAALKARGGIQMGPRKPSLELSENSAVPADNAKDLPEGSQLSIDLEQPGPPVRAKAVPIRPGEAALEIEGSAAEAPKASDGTVADPEMYKNLSLPPEPIGDVEGLQADNMRHLEPYDPTAELSTYEHPNTQLLLEYEDASFEVDRAELESNKDQIIETLLNYKIEIVKIKATIGPTVTLYEIVPAPGVRIQKIKNLEDDIALSLSALGIRIIAPIPGKGTIGIEVPNKNKQTVGLKELLLSDKFKKAQMDLPIALGKTIQNEVFVADLAKMPHLLIAGATGQGKSVGINVVLMSLLYRKHPSQVKLVLIDPKKVELSPYARLENHFLSYLPGLDEPIVTDVTKVIHTLNSLTIEMDERYNLLKKAQARNIREYNEKFVARKLNPEKGHRFLPFIVLVVDEFADLIMTAGKEVELPIGRLAQLSRAVGIHLIIATQRPSVNIITGVIKANFPARLAFKVTSKVDSRTILDQGGADRLIGRGDMLLSFGSDLVRLQCAFIDTPEVEKVIDFISAQRGYPEPYWLPEYHGEEGDMGREQIDLSDLDDMLDDAARLVVQNQHGSTSMIQRRLKLGYNRAGRIMDQLEALGIVGPAEGSKPREVLFFDEMELERYLEEIRTRK